jgi:SAM-dependent methyltransferase
VNSLFRADPTRTDDPVLDELLRLVRSGETWLDVGAGAGRFALPIARSTCRWLAVALDASPSMLGAEVAEDYAIENVARSRLAGRQAVEPATGADVGLIGISAAASRRWSLRRRARSGRPGPVLGALLEQVRGRPTTR